MLDDDYALYLAEEARSDIAALHQFRILFDPILNAYHLFFEGEEDSLYYMPEIRRRRKAISTHTYDCGGKKNVIEVRDTIIAEGYNLTPCLFFVDRDFDDFLGTQVRIDQHTYITEYYSIENDVASANNAQILIEDLVGLSQADPEFKTIIDTIISSYTAFYYEIRPLIAWILAAKEEGCKPNIRNTKGLKDIIHIDRRGYPILSKEGFSLFKKKVVTENKIPSLRNVIKWRRKLQMEHAKLWTRGKYDIWFFQALLLIVIDISSKKRVASGGPALRTPSSLREGRIFETLGGRIPIAETLRDFIDRKII